MEMGIAAPCPASWVEGGLGHLPIVSDSARRQRGWNDLTGRRVRRLCLPPVRRRRFCRPSNGAGRRQAFRSPTAPKSLHFLERRLNSIFGGWQMRGNVLASGAYGAKEGLFLAACLWKHLPCCGIMRRLSGPSEELQRRDGTGRSEQWRMIEGS